MAGTLKGLVDWELNVDESAHRTYTAKWLVYNATVLEGPAVAFQTVGLPLVGSTWAFGSDSDPWAYCWPDWRVYPAPGAARQERDLWWIVEQKFTTQPLNQEGQDNPQSPLLQPQKVGGSFVKYTREIVQDRFGQNLKTSSHEQIRGSVVEFDDNKPTVWVEQNVLSLDLAGFTVLIDVVNDTPMWGLPARCVKLSNCTWERKIFGIGTYYYTRRFEFDIDFNTFDRVAVDEGTMVLQGHSPGSQNTELDPNGTDPDTSKAYKLNPERFEVYKDINGDNTSVLLDGSGRPLNDSENPVGLIISHYPQANLFALGIPATF